MKSEDDDIKDINAAHILAMINYLDKETLTALLYISNNDLSVFNVGRP